MSKEEKYNIIRDHFFKSHYNLKNFHEQHYQDYGYKNPKMIKDAMIIQGITLKAKNEYIQNQSTKQTAEFKDYNLESLDYFGISESIGQDHLPFYLPEQFKKVGILSDIHVPFHHRESLACAISYLKKQEIDCLYLNGDIFDVYSLSMHQKEPDLRDFPREVEMCREFMQKIRDIFKHIPIYFKLGNHENRYARILQNQAEEFAQIHDLQFEIFFHLERLGFIMVQDWQGCYMGDLLVLHGHELYGSGGANPAQNLMNKVMCNALMGHVHKTSFAMKKTGFKESIKTYTTGCLTYTSPKYMVMAQHNQGFAIVEIENGKSNVHNMIIKDGKVL
jgi:UDP-2,3-diacylglucosamine pyrophosphatase LpxH